MEIGINAMSSIAAMQEDFMGVCRQLQAGGCTFIEAMSDWGARQETIDFFTNLTGGSSGWDPDNTVTRIKELKNIGMDIRGMFVFDEVLVEQAEDLGRYCQENGIHYIVLSFLHYDGIDDIYSKIDTIKATARIVNPYGVQILLHNHEHDSLQLTDKDGQEKSILQIILEQCTPKELMLEIDTGWLLYAGLDVAGYVKENLDRIHVLHLKDICKGYENVPREEIFCACGQGAVDFESVIKVASGKPDMIYVLDQDNSKTDITQDNIESIRYINGLRGKN